MFTVKINDEFCEWEYELPISDEHSIEDVRNKLFKSFKLKPSPGKLVWSKNISAKNEENSV